MSLKKITSLAMICICALAFGGSSTVHASVTIETFNSLGNGQIVDNEFSSGANGFTISGNNLGGGPDLVVIFDTFASGTDDPDLQDPFDFGNAATSDVFTDLQDPSVPSSDISRFFNALIIQESGGEDSSNPGFIDDNPDDEGGRPAGSISFAFNTPIDSIGFDLLDVEGTAEEPFSVDFSDGSTSLQLDFADFIALDGTLEFGNNSANRILPVTAEQVSDIAGGTLTSFNSVTFNLGGSGAIDNVTFTAVPEPTGLPILTLLGLVSLARNRRRK